MEHGPEMRETNFTYCSGAFIIDFKHACFVGMKDVTEQKFYTG